MLPWLLFSLLPLPPAAFCWLLPAPTVSVVVCHCHSHCCHRYHCGHCFSHCFSLHPPSLLLPLPLLPLHLPSLLPTSLVAVAIAHVITGAVTCPPSLLPSLLLPPHLPSLLHDTFIAIALATVAIALFVACHPHCSYPLFLPSSSAAQSRHLSLPAIVVMCSLTLFLPATAHLWRSRCWLIVVFLVDWCLTHCCHCSPNAIANASTNATPPTHCPPKPPPMLRCCCFNHCPCAAGAAFVFTHQGLSFDPAGYCVAYSCAASLPLHVLAPLDVILPPICPVGFRIASCHAATSWQATAFRHTIWLLCPLLLRHPLVCPGRWL